MNSAFVALLLSGLVIGIICFIVGSGLILLRIKGTATLTKVPGVGEVSTLRLGLTMMSIGGYFSGTPQPPICLFRRAPSSNPEWTPF